MKDRVGRKLEVGDNVVFLIHRNTSSHLAIGTVDGFTPKMIRIKCPTMSWTIDAEYVLRSSDKVVYYDKG
ncbi:hypothetical protein [Pseudomonas phage HMGUpa2]|nr:hypothetical protein Pa222_046 [Pseudomonas virus Pa222]WID30613.1 hypothetical protein [Pseudomonas phage HMGUpa2]